MTTGSVDHQGSWVFHERLCSYSFVNRVNYDRQIKHSACKGLKLAVYYQTGEVKVIKMNIINEDVFKRDEECVCKW